MSRHTLRHSVSWQPTSSYIFFRSDAGDKVLLSCLFFFWTSLHCLCRLCLFPCMYPLLDQMLARGCCHHLISLFVLDVTSLFAANLSFLILWPLLSFPPTCFPFSLSLTHLPTPVVPHLSSHPCPPGLLVAPLPAGLAAEPPPCIFSD